MNETIKLFWRCAEKFAARGFLVAALAAMAFAGIMARPAAAEDPQIAARRASQVKEFTDAQIIEGFFKIAFGAEFHVAGRVDRIRKFVDRCGYGVRCGVVRHVSDSRK